MTVEMQQQNTREGCMTRALESLEGLSCGDAFGECFFDAQNRTPEARASRILPPAPWRFTDDTAMAISVCACLERFGGMEPEWLAESFARQYPNIRVLFTSEDKAATAKGVQFLPKPFSPGALMCKVREVLDQPWQCEVFQRASAGEDYPA